MQNIFTEIKNLKITNSNTYNSYVNTIPTNQARIAAIELELQSIPTQLTALNTELEGYQKTKEEIEATQATFTEETPAETVAAAAAQLEEVNQQIAQVQQQINDLTSSRTELMSEKASKEAEITQIETYLARVDSIAEDITNEHRWLNNTYNSYDYTINDQIKAAQTIIQSGLNDIFGQESYSNKTTLQEKITSELFIIDTQKSSFTNISIYNQIAQKINNIKTKASETVKAVLNRSRANYVSDEEYNQVLQDTFNTGLTNISTNLKQANDICISNNYSYNENIAMQIMDTQREALEEVNTLILNKTLPRTDFNSDEEYAAATTITGSEMASIQNKMLAKINDLNSSLSKSSGKSDTKMSLDVLFAYLNNTSISLTSYSSSLKNQINTLKRLVQQIEFNIADPDYGLMTKIKLYDKIIDDKTNDDNLDAYHEDQIAIARGQVLLGLYEIYFCGLRVLYNLYTYWSELKDEDKLAHEAVYKEIQQIFNEIFEFVKIDSRHINTDYINGLVKYYKEKLYDFQELSAQARTNWENNNIANTADYQQLILLEDELKYLYFILTRKTTTNSDIYKSGIGDKKLEPRLIINTDNGANLVHLINSKNSDISVSNYISDSINIATLDPLGTNPN